MAELFANSVDHDQTPHSAATNLGLHCLPVIRSAVSSLQWVQATVKTYSFPIATAELSELYSLTNSESNM